MSEDGVLDFEDNTRTLRKWLDHGGVNTDKLVAELQMWLDYFAPSAAAQGLPLPAPEYEPSGWRWRWMPSGDYPGGPWEYGPEEPLVSKSSDDKREYLLESEQLFREERA